MMLGITLLTSWQVYAQEVMPQEEQSMDFEEEHTMLFNQGRVAISEEEIPQAVKEAYAESKFKGMSIVEAYEITGEALNEIPVANQSTKPDKLYELVVGDGDSVQSAVLYFTEEGELYDSIEKV